MRSRILGLAWLVALTGLSGVAAGANGRPEFVAFLSAQAERNVDREAGVVDHSDAEVGGDLLASYSVGRFRALAELVLTTDEQELERLQFGWALTEDVRLWLGRFHRPSNYWNTALHHGQYLQTSISRPGSSEWEDEGGYLASHSTGALIEAQHALSGGAGLQVDVALGAGAELEGGELEPFDILNTESRHRTAVDLRLAYFPDALGNDQMGITASFSDLGSEPDSRVVLGYRNADQITVSGYVDWQAERWRALSNVTLVRNRLDLDPGHDDESFLTAYAQFEYQLDPIWTAFVRHEDRWNDADSVYLAFFDEALRKRTVAGVRADLWTRHALTLELGRESTAEDRYGSVRVQWSAVLR